MRDSNMIYNTADAVWQWIDRRLERIWPGALVITALFLAIHGCLAAL